MKKLLTILVIAFTAIVCNAENWLPIKTTPEIRMTISDEVTVFDNGNVVTTRGHIISEQTAYALQAEYGLSFKPTDTLTRFVFSKDWTQVALQVLLATDGQGNFVPLLEYDPPFQFFPVSSNRELQDLSAIAQGLKKKYK